MRKRFLAILMIMVMLFSLPVYADDKISLNDNVQLLKTDTALISVETKDVSIALLKELLELNLGVTSNSMIEVLPIKDSDDTAICVSNIEENIITKNILISFYEDENGETKIDNSIAAAVTTNSVSPLYSASYGENTWRVYGQAFTEVYTHGGYSLYYRPYKCSFYYESNSNVNVSDITVNYLTAGYLYSQSSYTQVSSNLYEHNIMVYKANPSQGLTYSTTSYLTSGRVLYVPGGLHEGHFLSFTCYVNGVYRNRVVTL